MGAECTLSKHAENSKLGGMIDIWDGCAASQRNFGRLEKHADGNLMKFNKGMCKVLCLIKNNPMNWCRLETDYREVALCKRPWGDLEHKVIEHEPAVHPCFKVYHIWKNTASKLRYSALPWWDYIECTVSRSDLPTIRVTSILEWAQQRFTKVIKGEHVETHLGTALNGNPIALFWQHDTSSYLTWIKGRHVLPVTKPIQTNRNRTVVLLCQTCSLAASTILTHLNGDRN